MEEVLAQPGKELNTFSVKQDISWLLDKAISSFHFMQALKHAV